MTALRCAQQIRERKKTNNYYDMNEREPTADETQKAKQQQQRKKYAHTALRFIFICNNCCLVQWFSAEKFKLRFMFHLAGKKPLANQTS